MKKKNLAARMISGLLSTVMVLSSAVAPVTAFASEIIPEEEMKAYVESLPELGQVKVTFYEAKNADKADFSTGTPGTYKAVYYAEPMNEMHPVYRISRNIIVKEPVTEAQSAEDVDGGDDDQSGEEAEDADPDPEPEALPPAETYEEPQAVAEPEEPVDYEIMADDEEESIPAITSKEAADDEMTAAEAEMVPAEAAADETAEEWEETARETPEEIRSAAEAGNGEDLSAEESRPDDATGSEEEDDEDIVSPDSAEEEADDSEDPGSETVEAETEEPTAAEETESIDPEEEEPADTADLESTVPETEEPVTADPEATIPEADPSSTVPETESTAPEPEAPPEVVVISAEEMDAMLEEAETQDTYDEESGWTVSGVIQWATEEEEIDLAALGFGETASFEVPRLRGAKAGSSQTVDITCGTCYQYEDYGLGTYQTHKYTVKFGDVSATAYCVQPSRGVPGDGTFTITKLKDGKAMAKVCYCGTKAAGDEGFFAEKYPDFSAGKRFIITHMAAAYANGSSDAFSGTNDKETYFRERDEIIRTYKEQGRRSEIQAALEKIAWK